MIEPTRTTYDSFFVVAAPYVDVQIQLLGWIGFGLRAGLVLVPFELTASDSGPLDPPSLAPSGLYVRFSIVFGGIGAIGKTTDSTDVVEPTPLPEPETKTEPGIQTETEIRSP